MKFDPKKTVALFDKLCMTGVSQVMDTRLRFEDDGVKMCTIVAGSVIVETKIEPSFFAEYEALGNISINDFSTFVTILRRFKDDLVTVTKNDYIFKIQGVKKSVEFPLVDDKYVNSDSEKKELNYPKVTFTLEGKQLQDIFTETKLSDDSSILFTTSPGKVLVENTGKYKFTNEIDCSNVSDQSYRSEYGQFLIDAASKMKKDLSLSFGNNTPMEIIERTGDYYIRIIVGPIKERD